MQSSFAVIGEATRQALKAHGFQADLMPKEYCSQSLAEALINVLTPSDHVLWHVPKTAV